MTNPKDIHPIVMKVLDELSERYFIHKRPTISWPSGRGDFQPCSPRTMSGDCSGRWTACLSC